MFDDLDSTLQQMLTDPNIPAQLGALRSADISFDPPDRNFTPPQDTLNLFLYDVKENRVLRDPVPVRQRVDTFTTLSRPPLRVNCSYAVTAWSSGTGGARTAAEHRLLAQAMLWMSRFPAIPQAYRVNTLTVQPFDPLLEVAQVDPNQNENSMFWSALGIPPRATFYVTATISMELDVVIESPLVTTLIAWYQQDGVVASREELINIGGRVLDRFGRPAPDATVQITQIVQAGRPAVQVTTTGSDGVFYFSRLCRGNDYQLNASAPGLGKAKLLTPVPSETGEYDLQLQ